MDVARIRRRPAINRYVTTALGLAVLVAAIAWSVPVLFVKRGAAEPSVRRDGLVIDTVTRGTLERSVTAAGVLQPDRIHVVSSVADGVATDVPIRAGMHVDTGTVIATLDNPDLRAAVADAEAQITAARADVVSAREEAAGARLDRAAALRTARAEATQAATEADSYKNLYEQGLIGELPYRTAAIKSSEDRDLVEIARSKISVGAADADAKIASANARLAQLEAMLDARRAQLATLVIHAGAPGIVQSVAIDPGQRVTSGTEFARIAGDRDLKAVLQVAESDLRGVATGMPVRLTASDAGTVEGSVTRFAPAAENGTIAVDVELRGIPSSWRPDENVNGTIVMDRIPHALSLARPAAAGDAARLTLYRLDRDGSHAIRTSVTTAAGTDERIRVLSGLTEGDRAIVSDTSAFDAPSIRIQD